MKRTTSGKRRIPAMHRELIGGVAPVERKLNLKKRGKGA